MTHWITFDASGAGSIVIPTQPDDYNADAWSRWTTIRYLAQLISDHGVSSGHVVSAYINLCNQYQELNYGTEPQRTGEVL